MKAMRWPAGANHRQDPQGRDGDVRERLEPVPFQRPPDRGPNAHLLQLSPAFRTRLDRVHNQGHQDQAQQSLDRAAISRGRTLHLRPPGERQSKGKADREQKLRHDRVGIAAVRIVVLQHRVARLETAHEVDQEHTQDGVPAELVQR